MKLLFLFMLVWGVGEAVKTEKPIAIPIRVFHQLTNEALEGVAIEVSEAGRDAKVVFRTSTDKNGAAILRLKTKTRYQLKLAHPDFYVLRPPVLSVGVTAPTYPFYLRPITPGTIIRWTGIDFSPMGEAPMDVSRSAWLRLAQFLKDNQELTVEVGCHSDSRGSADYNLSLTKLRARVLRDSLLAQGVGAGRIQAKGYGERHLLNQCADGVQCKPVEHAQNRRVEVLILNKE